jgi:hypothetical protein
MKNRKIFVAALFVMMSLGCQHLDFPLCPVLARTKPAPDPDKIYYQNVGASLYNGCKKHHIRITVLSENVAEFSGTKRHLKWLQDNYHILLCDFDELSDKNAENDYISCAAHVKEWIKIIQSGKMDDLMNNSSKYCINCLPAGNCAFKK